MIEPGEGYRLLREGEQMLATDEYWSERAEQWEETDTDAASFRWSLEEWLPHRRKRVPLDDSIDRLRTAMDQSPYWAAALLQDLPQALRNDIATVLTHFIGDKP
jgi:hypothetical protein